MSIEEKLEILRKEWIEFPGNRDIIKRRARALEIAQELQKNKKRYGERKDTT